MSRIIVVDDEEDILFAVKALLVKRKYDVITFSNADNLMQQAIELHPDLILIDINLKGTDGRQVCQSLKDDLPFPVKILLLSGDAMALLPYHEHYADGILNKPFELEELEKKIQQHLA